MIVCHFLVKNCISHILNISSGINTSSEASMCIRTEFRNIFRYSKNSIFMVCAHQSLTKIFWSFSHLSYCNIYTVYIPGCVFGSEVEATLWTFLTGLVGILSLDLSTLCSLCCFCLDLVVSVQEAHLKKNTKHKTNCQPAKCC